MWVKAAPGLNCPKEGAPRNYITDAEPFEVPDDNSYYMRLIDDGSLVAAKAPAKQKNSGGDQ